jgi:hypothetical protein
MSLRLVAGVAALAGAAVCTVGAYSALRAGGGAPTSVARGPLTGILGGLVATRHTSPTAERAVRLAATPAADVGEVLRRHAEAESVLGKLATTGRREARSRAANMLAALELQDALLDPPRAATLLASATGHLREAVRLDRANEDAKSNLELVLTLRAGSRSPALTRRADAARGKPAHQGKRKPPRRATPGAATPGYGY